MEFPFARDSAIALQHCPWIHVVAGVGVEDIRLVYRDETETLLRQWRGGWRIRYRHYLLELARKPRAVRQVVPELVAELGEPQSE